MDGWREPDASEAIEGREGPVLTSIDTTVLWPIDEPAQLRPIFIPRASESVLP